MASISDAKIEVEVSKKMSKGRKFWVAIGPLFFILLVASVFAFLVGNTDPVTLEWKGRLSQKLWVETSEWSAAYVIAYIAGNVLKGGVDAIKAYLARPPAK